MTKYKGNIRFVAVGTLLAVLAGCGGGDGSTPVVSETPAVTGKGAVTLTVKTASLLKLVSDNGPNGWREVTGTGTGETRTFQVYADADSNYGAAVVCQNGTDTNDFMV